jgi:excisionase family DNA binding protein
MPTDVRPNPIAQAAYTVDEAASYISVGRVYMYKLINDGVVPSVKIGKCRRIPKIALDRLLGIELDHAA